MHTRVHGWLALVWVIVVLAGVPARAQGPWARWYFGKQVGLHFGPDSVVNLPRSAMEATEACATICDSTGNLLFYSNGERLWNRLHQLVPGGGDSLGGHRSSTQGCVIVPAPQHRNRYLVYTMNSIEQNLNYGLRMAEVETTADGRGRVLRRHVGISIADTIYNTPLTDYSYKRFTEKLALVRHANGRDYWLIMHLWNSNYFVSTLVGAALNDTASFVLSRAGMGHGASLSDMRSLVNAAGWLAASPDGRRLACAAGELGADLLDFDPATGRVSNARHLNVAVPPLKLHAYGAAFSPDGQMLYVSYTVPSAPFLVPNYVVQFDARLPANQVGTSGMFISTQMNPIGALQLGSDGRMYVSVWSRPALDRIEYPNVRGFSCLYHAQAQPLPGGNGWLGLPLRPNDVPRTNWLRLAADSACAGLATTMRALNVPMAGPLDTLVWDFGDGTRGRTSATFTRHTYLAPGRYRVRVRLYHVGLQTEATAWVTVRPAGSCTAAQPTIPNIITPNGDQLNDFFVLQGLRAADWRCRIFNRWGRRVFEAEAYQDDWQAAGLPAGVYYYQLINRQDGRTLKGTVEVMR